MRTRERKTNCVTGTTQTFMLLSHVKTFCYN